MLKKIMFLAGLILFHPATAEAQDLALKAVNIEKWPLVSLVATWPGEDETAERWVLRIQPDGPALPATALIRRPAEPLPGAIVAALDTSLSLSPENLAAAQKALIDYIGLLKPEEQLAILSFNDQVQLNAGFTGDKAALVKAVGGLKLGGQRTELYKSMLFALNLLKNQPGRRLLLVVSDGRDESSEPTLNWEVLKAAKEHKIQITAIGLAGKSAAGEEALKIMESFAEGSGGLYRKADNPLALSLAFYELLKERAPETAADYELKFDLSGLTPVKPFQATLARQEGDRARTIELTLTPPKPETAVSPEPASTEPSSTEPSAMESAETSQDKPETPASEAQAKENSFRKFLARPEVWGGAAFLLALAAFFLTRGRGRRSERRETIMIPQERRTVVFQPDRNRAAPRRQESPFALEFAELGLRFVLPLGTSFLGAKPDNDFQLDIPTVSGRHAEFKCTQIECLLKDLNSTNGSLVNGESISQSVAIKSGDMLKFGAAQAALRRVR